MKRSTQQFALVVFCWCLSLREHSLHVGVPALSSSKGTARPPLLPPKAFWGMHLFRAPHVGPPPPWGLLAAPSPWFLFAGWTAAGSPGAAPWSVAPVLVPCPVRKQKTSAEQIKQHFMAIFTAGQLMLLLLMRKPPIFKAQMQIEELKGILML